MNRVMLLSMTQSRFGVFATKGEWVSKNAIQLFKMASGHDIGR
jgi:hypothetical protein